MIQAVIFDFNGVLVDDEAVHFELFREVLAEEGVVMTDRDYHERYLGYDDRGCFAAALGDAGQAFDHERLDGLIERKARRYVEVADAGLRFFPFAAETLASIAARWPVAICSGALRSEIEYALERLNRRAQVAAIIAAEDAHKCKPDPAGYLQSLDALRTHIQARSPSTTPARSWKPASAWSSRTARPESSRPREPACGRLASPIRITLPSFANPVPTPSSTDWKR